MSSPTVARADELRRALLAVCVLDEVDVLPADDAVVLPEHAGGPQVRLDWQEAAAVLGDLPAHSAAARPRLASWLRLHRAVADLGPQAPAVLSGAVRALALTPGAALHPGPAWVRGHVLGCALEVGLGVVGVPAGPGGSAGPTVPVPLWPDVARDLGLTGDATWTRAGDHLDAMGEIAAHRVERSLRERLLPVDAGRVVAGLERMTATALEPVGGCDVPTLLASWRLRSALATADGSGMRAVAVPDRRRGWCDEARIDPVFVAAAWTATDPADRGLPRPVLVTPDEVVLARRHRA